MYKPMFAQLMSEKYEGYNQIYTDRSKTEHGVAAAVWGLQVRQSSTLQRKASIFTAEMQASQMAISWIEQSNNSNTIILTDSYRVIQSIHDKYSRNPTSRKIQHQIVCILQDKSIVICSIPSHVCIKGNGEADSLARSASKDKVQSIRMQYRDLHPEIREKLYHR